MNQEIPFIKYEQLLQELENTNDEKNLLLGNGFNNSLGVGTSYKDIFEKMKKEYSDYEKLEEHFQEQNQDIEALIGVLTEDIPESNKEFLSAYISNKVKLDFMKAANAIVQSKIKNICNNKNEGIYILFRKFINYFTLNYDPFLYLLLMKFKKPNSNTIEENNSQMNALGFTNTLNDQYASLTEEQQKLYKLIKEARANGTLTIDVNEESSKRSLSTMRKTPFTNNIKDFLKQKGHSCKSKDFDKVVDHFLNEEKNRNEQQQLKLFDGFCKTEKKLIYHSSESQNIFFIHGAFHIKEAKDKIYKITQTSEKALYTRIEEAINKEEEIICVFKDEDKLTDIKDNVYLENCYSKLKALKGSLVIIGCSLSDNDKHVFRQINNSDIDTVYISSMARKEEKPEKQKKIIEQDYEKAEKCFSAKNIVLFDAKSISYEETKEPQPTQ